MRISNLSCDVNEVIQQLNLKDVVLLGHSIGCGIIWSYIELYGQDNLRATILLDQSTAIMSICYDDYPGFKQNWFLMDIKDYSSLICSLNDKENFDATIAGHFKSGFVSKAAEEIGLLNIWLDKINDMCHLNIAKLMLDTLTRDWRDMLHTITIPSLVVGGRLSIVPWQVMQWVSQQIPNTELKILSEDEGGVHSMFLDPEGDKVLSAEINNFLGNNYK